jgi:hypothetical protein
VDERQVVQEIRNANLIFERGKFTVINGSNKPVETSANEILRLMAERFKFRDRRLNSPCPDKEN